MSVADFQGNLRIKLNTAERYAGGAGVRSPKELVSEMMTAPGPWMDAAIVVAFENRFEFVAEDHPDPTGRLKILQEQGGLAIGLAGVKPTQHTDSTFFARVFPEYEGQAWAHRYMDTLRKIALHHAIK